MLAFCLKNRVDINTYLVAQNVIDESVPEYIGRGLSSTSPRNCSVSLARNSMLSQCVQNRQRSSKKSYWTRRKRAILSASHQGESSRGHGNDITSKHSCDKTKGCSIPEISAQLDANRKQCIHLAQPKIRSFKTSMKRFFA
jgi:hypothetical protein